MKGTTNAAGKPTQTKSVSLAMSLGDQVVTPDANYALSEVTIYKPATLVHGNIKKDIDIGGVVGTLEGGGVEDTGPALIMGTVSEYNDVNGAVTRIGSYAFYNNQTIREVNFPEASIVNTSAFYSCSKLSSVNMSKLTYIASWAFAYCSQLSEITLPYLSIAGSNMFRNCSGLASINFPLFETVPPYAFMECTSLSQYYLPNITNINARGFYGCGLSQAIFSSVTHVSQSAFAYCSNLLHVDLPLAISIQSSTFYRCTSLSQISLPQLSVLASSLFMYCDNLSYAHFLNVNAINYYCFFSCKSLHTLVLEQDSCVLNTSQAFAYTPMINSSYLGYFGSIYVPASRVDYYKSSTNWVYFSDRITSII